LPVDHSANFELELKREGIKAQAVMENGEFIVLGGSAARSEWLGKSYAHSTYALLYDELRRANIIGERDGRWQFLENYAFKSPSAAASVVSGRSTSGTEAWRHLGSGLTYKDWETQKLSAELDALSTERAA
jgi:hypothetical protein